MTASLTGTWAIDYPAEPPFDAPNESFQFTLSVDGQTVSGSGGSSFTSFTPESTSSHTFKDLSGSFTNDKDVALSFEIYVNSLFVDDKYVGKGSFTGSLDGNDTLKGVVTGSTGQGEGAVTLVRKS